MTSHFNPSSGPSTLHIATYEADVGKKCWKVLDLGGKVVWQTTRDLVQDEVVESLTDVSGQTQWTIHRPITGWYLVLRSAPYARPQVHLSLKPGNPAKLHEQDVFTFLLRPCHLSPSSAPELVNNAHAVKPCPAEAATAAVRRPSTTSSAMTPSPTRADAAALSTSRAGGGPAEKDLRNSADLRSHDLPVVLCPLRQPNETSLLQSFTSIFRDEDRSFTCSVRLAGTDRGAPLCSFKDKPSIFGIGSCGVLELECGIMSCVGMPVSFWVAVSLAYLGFRDDKGAYRAAMADVQ